MDDQNCPHCPDGHQDPNGGSQPWSAWVDSVRDADGQPMQITVARSAGAHVAESDAQWVRERLNAPAPYAENLPLDHPLRRECRCNEVRVCRRCAELVRKHASSRTRWPAAQHLQQAADQTREHGPNLDPEREFYTAPLGDWLDRVANEIAWLAPFRKHGGGYGPWRTATRAAHGVLGLPDADGCAVCHPRRRGGAER